LSRLFCYHAPPPTQKQNRMLVCKAVSTPKEYAA